MGDAAPEMIRKNMAESKIRKVMFHIHCLGHGGSEHVVVTLAAEMVRKGLEVCIATAATFAEEYPLPEGVRRIGIGTSAEEEETLASSKLRKLRQKRLHKALLTEHPDVLYSFCRGANYRAVLASKGTEVPVIISVRSDPKVDYSSFVHKHYSRYLYRKAAGAVFQTTGARDFFPTDIAEKSAVLLNPISRSFQSAPICEHRRNTIAAVGRFHESKDYMTLVKAFERVWKKHPEYTLEIYGDDSGDNTIHQVREWIRSHHMAEQIIFMGNHADVGERIMDVACYVLSSKYEGMPNALMEAMSLGLPVVATDCPSGGSAALIEDGANGLLCRVGDDEEMAAAIGKMIEYPDEAERVAKEAMKIREKAGVERITEEWLSYAERVIGSGKRKG